MKTRKRKLHFESSAPLAGLPERAALGAQATIVRGNAPR